MTRMFQAADVYNSSRDIALYEWVRDLELERNSLLDRLAKAEQQIEEMHLAMAEAIRCGMQAEQERDEAKELLRTVALHFHPFNPAHKPDCDWCNIDLFLHQETKR